MLTIFTEVMKPKVPSTLAIDLRFGGLLLDADALGHRSVAAEPDTPKFCSIGQVVALLGLEHLRQWATLTPLASIDDKPAEVTITALVRSRFCELAAQEQLDADSSEMFTLGLFSVIDALCDAPLTELLDKLPFAPDVREALVDHKGPKGKLLECLGALESGDLDRAEAILPTANRLYIAALAWTDEVAEPPLGRWPELALRLRPLRPLKGLLEAGGIRR